MKGDYFMDNFVILQQMVAIDRAQNRAELRSSIQTLLRIIGSYTKSERVYIFDKDESTGDFCNSYEWCAENVKPFIEDLQSVHPNDMPYWLNAFERGDSVIIDDVNDVKDIMPSEYRLLTLQNIRSEISFPIFYKNELRGFIGVDNPHIKESESFLTLLGVVGGHQGNVRESLRMTELLEQRNRSLEKSLMDIERDQKFLSILSTDYISVYCVDLNLDTIEPLKLDSTANAAKINDLKARNTNCYSALIKSYYDKYVIKSASPDFLEQLGIEHLKSHISINGRLSFRYQVTPNSVGQEYFEAEAFPFDFGSDSKVLIGFKNIDDLVAYEQNSRRQLQEALDEATLNNEIISAISKIYFSIYRIDLALDMYEEVSSDNEVHRLTGRMGPLGAALGTTLAQTFSVIISFVAIRRMNTGLRIAKNDFVPRRSVLGEIVKIGLPVAVQDGCIQIAFIVITVIANNRGVNDAAAVGVVEKMISFIFIVPSSMLATVSALAAQNIGAGKHDRAEQILRYALGIIVAYGVIAIAVVELFAPELVGLFSKNKVVVTMGVQYISSYIVDCVLAGIHFSFTGYFCAYGKSYIGFIHNMIAIVCARIPGSYLASVMYPDTLFPMGFAAPAGSFISIMICVGAFVWMKRRGTLYKANL